MEKLSMGEYTQIVWAAYLLTALLLGISVWITLRAHQKAKSQLRSHKDL